jgi:hypothetical protein
MDITIVAMEAALTMILFFILGYLLYDFDFEISVSLSPNLTDPKVREFTLTFVTHQNAS